MATAPCPDRETLERFSLGELGAGDLEAIATHVEQCPDCLAGLQEADGAADPLVAELKCLSGKDGRGAAEPAAWASAVLSTLSRGGWRAIADAGFDLARRLDAGPVRLDRFEIQAELGVGSFGYVFRAWDPRHERSVALKVQRTGIFTTAEETEQFLREARSVARLQHASIVSLYETGQTDDGVGFLVCEYVDGITLEQSLREGAIEPSEACRIATELADTLAYAHERGVIHRDVKPSNIILDAKRRAHLMDFGLAKQQHAEPAMTSDGRIMGTPAYMAPEQARGASREVDARSDVYGLGVVLYEMLAGRRPFLGDRREVLLQVLDVDPAPPDRLRKGVPRDLSLICLKAISKAPRERYQTADEMARDLRRYQEGEPISARPAGHLRQAVRWCRRYPLAVSILAAVLLGSIAGLAYLSRLSEYFVRQTALEGARLETKMLDEVWRFYSEEIQDIDSKATNIAITENYRSVHPSLPLPATFAIDLGERISGRNPGMEVRVFSRYPWPGRKNGGPQDEFDLAALGWLEDHADPAADPPAEYTEFVHENGQRRLLYFTARHMETSCLSCHNHPQSASPKKDWKAGDVVGVMKIVRPLDREIENTRDGLRGAFVLMSVVVAVVILLSGAVMVVGQRKRRISAV